MFRALNKIVTVLILSIFFNFFNLSESYSDQKENEKTYLVAANPVKFIDLWKFWNASFYYKIDESSLIGGTLFYPIKSELSGIGIGGEYRYFIFAEAFRKGYLAPRISYFNLSEKVSDHSVIVIGASFGWQWIFFDHFAFGLGIGLDFFIGSGDPGTTLDSYEGTLPALRVELGYVW